MLNLIGVDDSLEDLRAIQPPSFDDAVKLGIDLTLAGHTHGGQLSLEFLRRGLCLSRLETRYVSGWYEKSGRQLYVNRGIGTTMIPIRLGARYKMREKVRDFPTSPVERVRERRNQRFC